MPTANQRNQAQTAQPLVVRPIDNKSELKTFIKIPGNLNKGDPCAVTRLYHERMQHFTTNPFFKRADWLGWVAWRGRKPVGRISAQIDHLHTNRFDNKTGFFGSLESQDDPEVFSALFDTAENWLKNKDMNQSIGPMNLNINQEIGLLIEGFNEPPSFMMGHSPPYYGQHIERLGYQKEVDLFAYNLRCGIPYTKSMQRVIARHRDQLKVRPLDFKNRHTDLRIMCKIFNDAWAKNWGFVPFTDEEFLEIGRDMLRITDADWMQIAEFEGEPAAFVVALPNMNEVIRDLNGKLFPFAWLKLIWRLKVMRLPTSGRLPLMGVLTKHQNSITGAALLFQLMSTLEKVLVSSGIKTVELSWILEHNMRVRKLIEAVSGEPYKTYRVYNKSL